MKIIQFITSLDDGGAETLVKDYAIKLKARGIDIIVVCVYNFKGSSNYRLLKEADITIIPLVKRYNIFTRIFLSLFGRFYIPFKLAKTLRLLKPNVLHIHLELLEYVACIADKFPFVKYFFTCHSEPYRKLGPQYPEELKSAKKLCKSHNLQVIALHNEMRKTLNDMIGIDNTYIIYNCVHIKRFTDIKTDRYTIRKRLGINDDEIVVGHVGRFSDPKNHQFIVDVFAETIKLNSKVKLLLIGNGALISSIKKKVSELGINDRVLFLSHRSDVPELMNAMDVFLFPSKVEGFPVTLIEIQAVGLPCVASDCITSEAFISSNVIPMSLNTPSIEWAKVLLSIVGNRQYDKRVNKFDIDNIVSELISLYTK